MNNVFQAVIIINYIKMDIIFVKMIHAYINYLILIIKSVKIVVKLSKRTLKPINNAFHHVHTIK